MGTTTRSVARRYGIGFLIGTVLGSVAPESGNFAAYFLGLPETYSHVFNILFAVLGVLGIIVALRARPRANRKSTQVLVAVDKLIGEKHD